MPAPAAPSTAPTVPGGVTTTVTPRAQPVPMAASGSNRW
ncbi:hypothetical protein I553_3307 [Mycobacterium xenopi 4042]|uniref:Uncharacterized protein n=1 Tax=Mycobacterium xenopi 4042 TaxID=1299334 RepID=X8CJS9_MYCXE|nr:hypothetical protein I553_3307 [Mycobacterium xenopi 4042]